jgi:hypothetical protein
MHPRKKKLAELFVFSLLTKIPLFLFTFLDKKDLTASIWRAWLSWRWKPKSKKEAFWDSLGPSA